MTMTDSDPKLSDSYHLLVRVVGNLEEKISNQNLKNLEDTNLTELVEFHDTSLYNNE